MILDIKSEHTPVFSSLVKEMVERENGRGDTLDHQRVMLALLSGQRNLLAIYENENEPLPLMLLIYHIALDKERSRSTLWIDNLFVPSGTALREKLSKEDMPVFLSRIEQYHRVMFVTDNPALLALIADLGAKAVKKQEIYQITAPEVCDG